jgi:hypothetical protein
MKDWKNKLIEKTGVPDLTDRLLHQLTGTELNTVLLHLFQKITEDRNAADLNQSFQTSRFFKPSPVDPILYKMLETDLLRLVKTYDYAPIELSPLAPLGTCSVLGPVDQFNVVSALRNSEVVADATNVMALIIAENIMNGQSYPLKYACTHRHTRSQALSSPAHTSHFGVLCLTTGGKDPGNFDFEINEFIEHIKIHHQILQSNFPGRTFVAKIFIRSCELHYSKKLQEALIQTLPD